MAQTKAEVNTEPLVKKLRKLNPEKIILFGSYANGNPSVESDVDVLIIKRTRKRPPERIAEVLDLVWGSIPHIEPYILTPDEFKQSVFENRFFLTQEVLKYGKTIYERAK